tara:strand:+ start:502 stop:789 length:288 start_codon:yes stop_codon:yes gene_type:complete
MLLSDNDIEKFLHSYDWGYSNNKISKLFSFNDYMDGIDFVMKIAELAEKRNHHPDIFISWCKVEISLTSHEIGGVTMECISLAKDIENVLKMNNL